MGRRRGARARPRVAARPGRRGARRLRGREGGAPARAARVARAPRGVPAHRLPGQVLRRGLPVGRAPRPRRLEGRRGRARAADQGHPQGARVRHRRHRGLHRGRRRADPPGVGALPDDEGQGRRQRRDALPRAQGALRLPLRLRRVLPRRHGRRGGPRPARAGRPGRRADRARGPDQDRQGPEAGPRGQAPEGGLRLHQLGQPPGPDGPRGRSGDPAGAAADGPARRRALRHLGPQRPLPARHQPQQPPQAAARPRRARDHRQQREADAPGGRRRAVRQRPPRPARHGPGQPRPEVPVATCSRASRAASARTCWASAWTTRAARSSWPARRCACTSAACRS